MAQVHDDGAELCGNFILSQIRQGNREYQQIFSTSMHRIGDFDWPRPDFICFDDENEVSYALEYKPPMQSKREYVCGLGQTITYLQHHTYGGLIVPERADDGYPIAEFMQKVISADTLSNCPISLFSYNQRNEVKILKGITRVRDNAAAIEDVGSAQKTFWCWWRDMSHYEVLDLLKLSLIHSDYKGDAYTDRIYPAFADQLFSGKTLDFDGNPRKKTKTNASYNSEKQNYRIPFEQLGLWSSKEGKISELGYRLLEIGTRYGADSANYKGALARLVLTQGKHYELLKKIKEIQETYEVPKSSDEYRVMLEDILTSEGLIGPKKPGRKTSGDKVSYIRDEPKLWNKFGILKTKAKGKQYFFPNEGYKIDMDAILDIMLNKAYILD